MIFILVCIFGLAGPPDGDGDGYPATIDCNDGDGSIHPLAAEIPYDGIDQDCTGDDQCDVDGDGSQASECGGPDCDDADATRRPDAVDIPGDGIDQNCDGADAEPQCDLDGDGALAPGCGGDDCNDLNAAVNPGATEINGDGIDQDCDGLESCPTETWYGGGTCQAGPSAPSIFYLISGLLLVGLRRRPS
ncbi:MAG: putative metal-binding motif-containing protein [Myxococcota bacterium]